MKRGMLLVCVTLAITAVVPLARASQPVIDWDPAYMWQPGATPTNMPAGDTMRFVGTVSMFGPPLDFLNATMPATEYTFTGDNLVSLGTATFGSLPTQIYTTSYSGGVIKVYADPTPNAVFTPFPPNSDVPSTFEDDPPPILIGDFTRFVVTTNSFSQFQVGNIEGDINWTGGTLIDRFRASNGAICPGLFTGGATWNTAPGVGIPGYLFRHDGKIDLQCPVPTRKSTWGVLKQLYH